MVYYGLLLFFVLEYVRPASYFPALNVLHLNSLVPLSVLVGSMFTKRVKASEVLRSPNARWIMFFMALMVISGLFCDVKIFALNKFEIVLGYIFMFTFLKKELYDLDRIKGALTILVLVHLVVGVLTPEMFSGDGQRHYIASGSFLGDGNDFALSVNITIPFCLFMMLESQSVTKKLFYGGILLILIMAVVATQSRGGMIALVCTGLYYWIKTERKVLGVIGATLIAVFVLAMAPPQFFDRMQTMTQTGEEMEGSAQGRILAWNAAIRMAADHPLLGVGLGHFAVKYGVEYRPEGYGKNEIPWQTAHSSYFLILGELGIPGIVFLVMIIATSFIACERTLRGLKARSTKRDVTCRNLMVALNASLVGFAVGGAFLSATYYPHIFLLAALSECGRDLCRNLLMPESVVQSTGQDTPLGYRSAPL